MRNVVVLGVAVGVGLLLVSLPPDIARYIKIPQM